MKPPTFAATLLDVVDAALAQRLLGPRRDRERHVEQRLFALASP